MPCRDQNPIGKMTWKYIKGIAEAALFEGVHVHCQQYQSNRKSDCDLNPFSSFKICIEVAAYQSIFKLQRFYMGSAMRLSLCSYISGTLCYIYLWYFKIITLFLSSQWLNLKIPT